MSYDYDFNTILKSALLKNNYSNKSVDAFNNDCMYAPFNNINNDSDNNLECTTMSMIYNERNDIKQEDNDIKQEDNDIASYNYESLIEDNIEKEVVKEGGVERIEDSSNFFMQGSMKDNYKIVDNNFKEIAEKILLDINCDENTLNKEVENYEKQYNSGKVNINIENNIKNIINMYNDINKKINTLHIETNAIQSLESNLQTIIDNLKINNKTNDSINNMENKFKNNINNVIYYNTYFKFIIYLKQQKNILEESIDIEQLNLNAIMYLVMKNKWFEIAPTIYKFFNQHLPC
jgi:hypothetical protein